MNKHTSGQWIVRGVNTTYYNAPRSCVVVGDRVIGQAFVAKGLSRDGFTHCSIRDLSKNEVEANARLMAAAPDLLDVARIFQLVIESGQCLTPIHKDIVMAAIQKAEIGE